MATKPTPEEVAAYQKEIRARFDALTPEQRKNVIEWGNPNGLKTDTSWQPWEQEDAEKLAQTLGAEGINPDHAVRFGTEAAGTLARVRAARLGNDSLSELAKAAADHIEGLNHIGEQNFETFAQQFGRAMPLTYRGGIPGMPQGVPGLIDNPDLAEIAAYINPNATQSLADQLTRLSSLYPGITSRLHGLQTGVLDKRPLAWYTDREFWPDRPGVQQYDIGVGATPSVVRGVTPQSQADYVQDLVNSAPERGWLAATRSPALYAKNYDSIMAHELGHATHASMSDFASALPEGSEAAAKMDLLNQMLGMGGARNQAISGYADAAARDSIARLGLVGREATFNAASEPFAELFSLARSPQGLDIMNPNIGIRSAAIRDLVGNRSGEQAATLMDRVGALNTTEKALRNEGFNEVGAAMPGTVGSIAAPVALGLLAAKTHGTARNVLAGAAGGAGLGAVLGPEGALAGGTIGGGLALAKQLL